MGHGWWWWWRLRRLRRRTVVAFVEDDHLAQFYVGIDPKLIYVKVEWTDRDEASGTYKLVWDKCNCCWCARCLYMHSSRASLFAGGFG